MNVLRCKQPQRGGLIPMIKREMYMKRNKKSRNGKYAFEALTVLIDQIHRMAPDRAFISFVEPQNIASMGLLRKLGYRDMGYVPEIESQMFGKWTN